jgi:hypothetical protein
MIHGTYKIIKDCGFWCVGRLVRVNEDGEQIYRRVSNHYSFRGWAQAFCRRMKIQPINYEA